MNGETLSSPCDLEPCKSALVKYEMAKGDLEEAVANVKQLKERLAWAGMFAATGAVVVAGGVVASTTPLGPFVIAGGAAVVLGAGIAAFILRRRINAAREVCGAARRVFTTARDGILKNCPRQCWPLPFPDLTCP